MGFKEWIIPQEKHFFDMLEQQADIVVEGAEALLDMVKSFDHVAEKRDKIKDIEHKGDDITHRAFARLHTQFITPFDRSEIHRLLSRIDDVLDLADAASERLGLYDIDSVLPEARELCAVLVAQSLKMEEAVKGLRTMKKDPSRILEACKEMNKLENQADSLTRRTMAKLFKRGNDPLTVMKWKEIIDLIEDATDRAEDVANVIEGVVLEHA